MKSRNRILSGILSCLTCLGSVGSAAKGKPAASPAGEARRKNGRKKRRNRNANKRADISPGIDAGKARNKGIVPGASTTSPGSGLSGRDIGFLAGGATLGSIGGYFLGKKWSGNGGESNGTKISDVALDNGTKISDVALDKIVSSCSGSLDKKEFLSFIEAIAHAKVTFTKYNNDGDVSDVDITFDKNFGAAKLGSKLSFRIEYCKTNDTSALQMTEPYKFEFKVGGELCFCIELRFVSVFNSKQEKFDIMSQNLVLAILHRFFPNEFGNKLSGVKKYNPFVMQSQVLLTNILLQGIEKPSGK